MQGATLRVLPPLETLGRAMFQLAPYMLANVLRQHSKLSQSCLPLRLAGHALLLLPRYCCYCWCCSSYRGLIRGWTGPPCGMSLDEDPAVCCGLTSFDLP